MYNIYKDWYKNNTIKILKNIIHYNTLPQSIKKKICAMLTLKK